MTYTQVIDGTVEPDTEKSKLPDSARRLDTGEWVFFTYATEAEQQACGWFEVVDTARPPDTDTTTHDRSLVVTDGVPVETWTPRPWTEDEKASRTAAENHATLTERIGVAIDTLLATVDNLNAITNIPNATINANPAAVIKDVAREVKTVARQTIDIARVVSGELDSTDNGS